MSLTKSPAFGDFYQLPLSYHLLLIFSELFDIYDNEIGHVRRLTFRLALIVRNFCYFPLACVI